MRASSSTPKTLEQTLKESSDKKQIAQKISSTYSSNYDRSLSKPMNAGWTNGMPAFDYTASREEARTSYEDTQLQNQYKADPWSYYRSGAADNLAKFGSQEDPSNIFRDRLTQMSTGKFSPDDPSYKWRFEQGQQAVERSLGARGLLNSGNAAIELQQYGQGAASQEYAAQFSRLLQGMQGVESQYDSQFSRLSQMAGISLDPTAQSKIDAGIQQAQIGASASVTSASIGQQTGLARVGLDREINQQQEYRYDAYDRGLGDALKGKNV